MKKPFTYKFTKEVSGTDKDKLLEDFKQNFIETDCYYKIIKKENSLVFKNKFEGDYTFSLTSPWNMWYFISKLELNIHEIKQNTKYSIVLSISVFAAVLLSVLFIAIASIGYAFFFNHSPVYFTLILTFLFTTRFLLWYYRHKRFFFRTIDIGNFRNHKTKTSYDWDTILKEKSDTELADIIKGKTSLPDLVIELAKKEKAARENSNL